MNFDDERDYDDLQRGRPETDLSEGNASPHYTEDYRRPIHDDLNPHGLWIDPVTGEPTVLP